MKSNKTKAALLVFLLLLLGLNIFSNIYSIDNNSLILVLLIFILIYIPDIGSLLNRVKKFKIGDSEIEFAEKVLSLERKTNDLGSLNLSASIIPQSVMERINSSLIEPRGALISVGIEIENRLKEILKENQIKPNPGYFSPRYVLDKIIELKEYPPVIKELFNEFWIIRNQASHAYDFEVTKEELYTIINTGIKLLEYLYQE